MILSHYLLGQAQNCSNDLSIWSFRSISNLSSPWKQVKSQNKGDKTKGQKAILAAETINLDKRPMKHQNQSNSERNKNKNTEATNFHPVLRKPDVHPYPYLRSPDVYFMKNRDDEDQKPSKPLDEAIVEKFILENAFAKEFLEEFLGRLVEPEVRGIVTQFTTRQGPANKPTFEIATQPPALQVKDDKKSSGEKNKDDVLASEIEEKIINEEIESQIRSLLWDAADEMAMALDPKIFQKISDNERGYSMSPELLKLLNRVVMEFAQGMKMKKRPHLDHKAFKDTPLKNYVYNFHKFWHDLMASPNFAEDQIKLGFMNEATWEYFHAETLKSIDKSMKDIDKHESENIKKGL